MQLDKLVNYHKTLGDPTRIRIIALLKQQPLHGQAIAQKLGLKPATITHHVSKLRDVGIIYEMRDKNTIYFYLAEKKLEQSAQAILQIGEHTMFDKPMTKQQKDAIIQNFLNSDGTLQHLPSKLKKKILVLAYLIDSLEPNRIYSEHEINLYIRQYHEDYATIRREWVMHHFIYRKNNQYQLNPTVMWPVVYRES